MLTTHDTPTPPQGTKAFARLPDKSPERLNPDRLALTVGVLTALMTPGLGAQSANADPGSSASSVATLPTVTVEDARLSDRLLDRAERTEARELRDLFAREPEFDVGGGVRQGRRLHLRGIEASNVRITVDGAAQGQNLYNHRGGAQGIDPFLLKQVEVQPGPLPADAGPGGLGGAIRFETVDAQDLLAEGQPFGASTRLGYASAQRAKTGNLAVYGRLSDHLGLLASVGATNASDQRIGGGERTPFSGYDDRDGLVKVSYLDSVHSFRLAHNRNRTEGLNFQQRGDFPVELQPPFENRPPRDQTLERDTTTLSYRFDAPNNPWVDIEVRGFRNDVGWRGQTGGGAPEIFETEKKGASLRNHLRFTTGPLAHELTFGADHEREQGEAIVGGTRTEPFANRFRTTGFFVQDRAQLDRAYVSGGARLDRLSARYRNVGFDTTETSLNLGGGVFVTREIELFAGYGEAARAAGTIPVHFTRNVTDDATVPDRPERSRNIEAGLRFTGGAQAFAGGQPFASVTVFRNRIEDFILYEQPGTGGRGGRPVTAIFNQDDDIVSRGGLLRLGWQNSTLRTEVSYYRNRIRGLPTEEHFFARAGAPTGDQIQFDVLYRPLPAVELGYTLTHVRDLEQPRQTQIDLPGYTLHDVSVRYTPPQARNLTLGLAVNNLTDRRYASHSTLTQGEFVTFDPGRDVRAYLRYTF